MGNNESERTPRCAARTICCVQWFMIIIWVYVETICANCAHTNKLAEWVRWAEVVVSPHSFLDFFFVAFFFFFGSVFVYSLGFLVPGWIGPISRAYPILYANISSVNSEKCYQVETNCVTNIHCKCVCMLVRIAKANSTKARQWLFYLIIEYARTRTHKSFADDRRQTSCKNCRSIAVYSFPMWFFLRFHNDTTNG